MRISLIEPGAVDTELFSHVRPEVQARLAERFEGVERLHAEDIAGAITHIVTRPRRMAVNEILIRLTEQKL